MANLNFDALLSITPPNNATSQLLNNLRPARDNMAVVEPVAVPHFPVDFHHADAIAGDNNEVGHEMEVDDDIDHHRPPENDHSMMGDRPSTETKEVERVVDTTDSVDEKAICPEMD